MIHQATFEVPSDTYAGATQIMFVSARLRHGERETIRLHAFNCVPTPKVFSIAARISIEREEWPTYLGKLLRLRLNKDFGWFGILIIPFLPKVYAWFDPSDNWNYVGGSYDRYYKGPHILAVRDVSR